MKPLKGKKNISKLFTNEAKKFSSLGLSVRYLASDENTLLVTAPIKKWKRAVDRNTIKRVLRKAAKQWSPPITANYAFIWNGDYIPTIEQVLNGLRKGKIFKS